MICRCSPQSRCGRRDLAVEIAERNDRCGHQQDGAVCLKPQRHNGDHEYESSERVVPFE